MRPSLYVIANMLPLSFHMKSTCPNLSTVFGVYIASEIQPAAFNLATMLLKFGSLKLRMMSDIKCASWPNSLSNYPVLRLTIHEAIFCEQDSQAG